MKIGIPQRSCRAVAVFLLQALLAVSLPLSAEPGGWAAAAGRPVAASGAVKDAPASIDRPPGYLPLTHWAYPLLERLSSRGVVDIDLTTRPVSRRRIVEALEGAGSEASVLVGLSERETWALERLRAEFLRGEVDAPAFHRTSGEASLGLGVTILTQLRYGRETVEQRFWPGGIPGGVTDYRPIDGWDETSPRDVGVEDKPDDELDIAADINYELWGGLGDGLGFYSDAQILLGGQEGARKVRLSSRVRTWRGSSVASERSYFRLERPNYSVMLGRRATTWGRSRWGRLLLSGNAPTLDQLEARLRLGPVSFQAFHSLLEYVDASPELDLGDDERVFLAGHRLTAGGGWGSVGLGEAVVYSSVTPDPVYLNPLVPYYVSQHNERANDNVLWLVDFVYHARQRLDVYGEFLIDDLQYERTTGHPDKYGITIGEAYYGSLFGRDLELTAEYTNVRKWTYTHGVIEHRLAHDGVPLGFELGPDADRLVVEVIWHPGVLWSAGVAHAHARKGEGRLEVAFEDGQEHEPEFPSGVVEVSDRTALEIGYQNLEGLSAGVGAAYYAVENAGNLNGVDDDGWEFWAGVRFRI